MVLDNDLKPLHELSKEGKIAYENYLGYIADDLIFKKNHPFLNLIKKLNNIFGINSELVNRKYTQYMNKLKEDRL